MLQYDPHYTFFDTGVVLAEQEGWKAYLLNMTSQQWLTTADVDRSIWTHQLLVVVPTVVRFTDTAALWITGGDNDNPSAPGNYDEDVLVCASLATSAGTVCSVLYQVPNQPLLFTADWKHEERSEDGAVAFTWFTYMLNSTTVSPEWILYFPMVKAAVRAMDTTAVYAPKVAPGVSISKFMVFGASKRGWTTWLTGAVDSRIIGIAPVVMDLLNFKEGVQGMWQSLGGWTFAFTDYYAMNIPAYFGTPAVDVLAAVIDPLQYAANLTMPKLVIDATGDEFFQLQDDSYWWGQLPGETLRMMIDNAEHSMATGALYLITGVEAWYWALLTNTPRPTFNWSISDVDGSITITTTGRAPDKVVLRFTTTLDGVRRDFRLISGDTPANPCQYIPVQIFGTACLRPIFWVGETVASLPNDTSTWVLTQPLPPTGWRAFLAELYYPGPAGSNTTFQLTTQASIIPRTFPFPPCAGEGCMGPLV
jgi:PhoPQ-activated pathogenicity-related protein